MDFTQYNYPDIEDNISISSNIVEHVNPLAEENVIDFNVQKDEDDKVMTAMENLNRCGNGIAVENAIVKTLILVPPILQVEESLLSLGSHGNVDGISHCLLIKVDVSGKETFLARYFEFGSFTAYFENVALGKLKQNLGIEEILPYCTFTIKDVEMEIVLKNETFCNRAKNKDSKSRLHKNRNFNRIIYDCKGGLNESLKKLSIALDKNNSCVCYQLITVCLFKDQLWEGNSQGNKRFFVCQPSEKAEEWENSLMFHRSNPQGNSSYGKLWTAIQENPSLENQFSLLSDLPNHHKWMWDKLVKILRYELKFSTTCRYFPGSPRNRILQAFFYRNNYVNIKRSCLKNIFNIKETFKYPSSKGNLAFKSSVAKKIRLSSLESIVDCSDNSSCEKKIISDKIELSDSSNEVHLVQHLGKKCSLYEYFCAELFNRGVLSWRIRGPSLSICVMNNYSHESGNFQLASKSGVERYSVVSDSCAFVTVFQLCRSLRKVVKCHDSLCRISEGYTRQVNNLDKGILCPHLKVFREHFYLIQNTNEWISNDQDEFTLVDESEDKMQLPKEKWEDVFDVASGLWTFGLNAPSKKTISSDQFNDKFSSDIVKRQSASNGYPFMPSADLGVCECGAGWVSESFSNGVTEFYHKINMYTDREVVECDVYLRKCLSNNCTAYWDGWEDSVFCLSKSTCAGYEFGVGINNSPEKMVAPSITQDTSNTVLDYLNINGGIVSLKNPDLVLTNSHFLQICKEKDKFNLTWPQLTFFLHPCFSFLYLELCLSSA
nr:uncharacterized protein LOC105848429 [Hydra vulgaris]